MSVASTRKSAGSVLRSGQPSFYAAEAAALQARMPALQSLCLFTHDHGRRRFFPIDMNSNTQTDRTTVKRLPKRGQYDRETINAILDEGFICHVGFVVEGQPYVIPTGYARVDDCIYIHGSSASRMLRNLSKGV